MDRDADRAGGARRMLKLRRVATPTESKTMKLHIGAALWAISAATLVWAGPLEKENVSADAKWLLHWDVEGFRKTEVGDYFGREVLDKKLAKGREDLKTHVGFDFDWRKVRSLTAYGTSYDPHPEGKGVLVVQSDMDVEKGFEGAITKLAEMGVGDGGPVRRIEPGPRALYGINDDVFFATQPGKPVLISKSREELRRAREVLEGKRDTFKTSHTLAGFPSLPEHFFLLAGAEGFNELAPIAPKAQVLKLAEGLRLTLGEAKNQLALNLSLKAKTEEVTQQIQQVVQGLIALVALGQVENPDLQQLVQSAKVSTHEKLVTVDLRYPVDKAIAKIAEGERRSGEDRQQKRDGATR
jgi:hypothetical protein